MNNWYKPFRRVYLSLVNSLAFRPALISAGLFLLALFMLYFEKQPLAAKIQEPIRLLLVSGAENARLVLTVLGSGIISLMVFSFSMVMIILTMATSNLSPRVIPGLLTVKSYQVVLGMYIGTILYVLLMSLNLEEGNGEASVPELSIFVGMILGIACIGMFVYFIHSVSRSIQVDIILQNVYVRSAKNLGGHNLNCYVTPEQGQEPQTKNWAVLPSAEEGYLSIVELEKLLALCTRQNLQLEILVKAGDFVSRDQPLMRVNPDVSENRELISQLRGFLIFSFNELDLRHYQFGMHQLSEIAVKALSPGINDPGTATKAVDLLSLLFKAKMKSELHRFMADEQGTIRIIRAVYTLDELLYRYLAPIRHYGRADARVLERLLVCMFLLIRTDTEGTHRHILERHLHVLEQTAAENLANPADRAFINQLLEKERSKVKKAPPVA